MIRAARIALVAAAGVAVAGLCLHAAATHAVSQKGKTFGPATLTVKVGDTVAFKNDDDVTHNAFSTSKGNEFNSKAQTPGSTTPVVFRSKGTVDVKCAFHPKMSLKVVVE